MYDLTNLPYTDREPFFQVEANSYKSWRIDVALVIEGFKYACVTTHSYSCYSLISYTGNQNLFECFNYDLPRVALVPLTVE